MRLLLALALAGLPPWLHAWPIGSGPRYRVPATTAVVRAGKPIGRLRCSSSTMRFAVHVEVFANRRVVPLPAGIGVSGHCRYPLRTTAPTGVVEVAVPATLGDLFRVWGQRLGTSRLLSFRSPLLVFVGGTRRLGDPRTVALHPHEQLVLEVGGYVPPHPTFLFPKGMP
jgi:hypothetical protein